jgi:hypothetical protein
VTKFAKIPPATLRWEGLGWYNNGYSHSEEYEVALKRKSKDTIQFGDYILSPTEAYELYTDLVSATLAVVVQKGNRKHAVQIQTVVQVLIPNPVGDGNIDVPNHFIEEIIAWLRYVLGIMLYTADTDIWEY